MSTRTDSHIVEHHDDGTWTETVVYHGKPATKKEKATALALLGTLVVVPFTPLIALAAADWWDRRVARKAEAKKLKSI